MRARFEASRDQFATGLVDLGFEVLPSEGTYFLNVDISPLGADDDVAFCTWLVKNHGVAAVPVSAFYAEGTVRNVVRFCFAKHDGGAVTARGRGCGERIPAGNLNAGPTRITTGAPLSADTRIPPNRE